MTDEFEEGPDEDADEEEAVSPEPGARGGFLAGLLFGAALGAVAALLLAPESGARTRRRLGKQVRRVRRDAEREARRIDSEVRRRLADLAEKARG